MFTAFVSQRFEIHSEFNLPLLDIHTFLSIYSFAHSFGQLGFGDTDDRSYPMNLKFLNSLKASYIACGENFTAVLTLDGGVFTFGAGTYGQLGHGQLSHEHLPRKIPDLMGSQVSIKEFTCKKKSVVIGNLKLLSIISVYL